MARVGWAIGLAVLVISCHREPVQRVRETVGSIQEGGGVLVPTRQLIRPAGRVVEFGGRPVSLVVAPDGGRVYVKDNHSVVAIDAAAGAVGGVRQELPYAAREGGSIHGLAISADGAKLYVTTTLNRLREIEVGKDGKMSWGRAIDLKVGLPGPILIRAEWRSAAMGTWRRFACRWPMRWRSSIWRRGRRPGGCRWAWRLMRWRSRNTRRWRM